MNCQRCLKAQTAVYRVYSNIIDLKVCADCASEAWRLGLSIEVLDHGPADQYRTRALTSRLATAGSRQTIARYSI